MHFETELALLIGERMSHVSAEEAMKGVVGVGLALDLTLREVQSRLKEKGHPWEIAKSFDGACPLSQFLRLNGPLDWSSLNFSLDIDDERRQTGDSGLCLRSASSLSSSRCCSGSPVTSSRMA